MHESSSGLPPVGELVQITLNGQQHLAVFTEVLGGCFTTIGPYGFTVCWRCVVVPGVFGVAAQLQADLRAEAAIW